jgi:hypothetical protein
MNTHAYNKYKQAERMVLRFYWNGPMKYYGCKRSWRARYWSRVAMHWIERATKP